VKPPFFEKLRNSIAQRSAPGISKIERGSAGSRTYASYAASKQMSASRSVAHLTQRPSCSRVATDPVGLFGKQRNATSIGSSGGSGTNPFSGVARR